MQYVTIRLAQGAPGEVHHPLALCSAPVPTPRGHEVLIKMAAAALNHRDFFIRKHLYPGTTAGVPLLADGAGTVVAVGEAASPRWLHKRVVINPGSGWQDSPAGPEAPSGWYSLLGGTRYNDKGMLTEYLAIDEGEIEEAPAHLSATEAAALPVTALTAWRALTTKAGEHNSREGATILVTGIGGGVALMALKFAVARGADVWVTSSSAHKIQRAVELGARGGVNYREPGWEDTLLGLLPRGLSRFDAIIDGAGGDVVEKGVRLLKPGGVLVVYGMTLAPRMDFTMQAVLRNIDVRGSTMGSRKEYRDMIDFVKQSRVRPVVSKVVEGIGNLDAIEGLFTDIRDGNQFGKLVIKIGRGACSKM